MARSESSDRNASAASATAVSAPPRLRDSIASSGPSCSNLTGPFAESTNGCIVGVSSAAMRQTALAVGNGLASMVAGWISAWSAANGASSRAVIRARAGFMIWGPSWLALCYRLAAKRAADRRGKRPGLAD